MTVEVEPGGEQWRLPAATRLAVPARAERLSEEHAIGEDFGVTVEVEPGGEQWRLPAASRRRESPDLRKGPEPHRATPGEMRGPASMRAVVARRTGIGPVPGPQAAREPGAATTATTIQVTIGRIEVKATPPAAPRAAAARTTPPVMSLDQYLRARSGGASVSDSLAVAAVTATLRNLIAAGAQGLGAAVTTQPLDRARGNNTANQINLFLYLATPSAAWRNTDIPGQVKPGERGVPPLGLNLYYLMTVFGDENEDDIASHSLLGRVVSVLHDHPVLGRREIRDALSGSDLADQIERIRLTLQPLTVEDVFKLWSGFQTHYRLSVAYEASVVLIDSTRSVVAAPPVLSRGQDDSGVTAEAGLTFPQIRALEPPGRQAGARLGEVLTVRGRNFTGDAVTVQFRTARLADPIEVAATEVASDPLRPDELKLKVPLAIDPATDPDTWPAGMYSVAVVVTRGGRRLFSNALAFALVPRILSNDPLTAPQGAGGDPILTLDFTPKVRDGQRASALVGDVEVPAEPFAGPTGTLNFNVKDLPPSPPGGYVVRLRVDGVDSLPFDPAAAKPAFDPNQRLTLP